MNHNDHDIETILSQTSFRELSTEEQDRAWERVALVGERAPLISLIKKPMLTSLLIALAISLGVGGTVVTADNAVPGDALFGLDRAVENLRINLAGQDKKDELRIKFADERVSEINKIATQSTPTLSMERPASDLVTETTVSGIEADVFINETVIKIEYSGKKFVFTNEAKTKEAVVDAVVSAFPKLSKTFVESKLDFELEDRSSRVTDKDLHEDDFSSEDRVKVTTGLNTALALLNGVSASLDGESAQKLKSITDQLNAYLSDTTKTGEARIKSDEDETRIDLRTEDGRIRVEVKDGELRIKSDDSDKNKGWDDKSDDSDDDSDDNSDDSKKGKSESKKPASVPSVVKALDVEADVFTNETVVKVEIGGVKNTFTTSAKTKAEIIAAVIAKYPTLTSAQVEVALDLQTEDRASTLADIIGGVSGGSGDDDDDSEDSDDSDEGDDSDEDSDDDSDDSDDEDDNSGKGKGGDDDDDN